MIHPVMRFTILKLFIYRTLFNSIPKLN